MNSLPEQIIIDILKLDMGIPNDHIWMRDENVLFPKDKELFIIVGMVDGTVISSNNKVIPKLIPNPPNPDISGMVEQRQVLMSENIQIDILSRGPEARLRRWQVLTALRSVYAQQQQESNYFKIYRIPRNFLNTSYAEGSSQLNRYSVTINCQVWYNQEKVLNADNGDFYNDFSTRVDDEKTIGEEDGLIEFQITEE